MTTTPKVPEISSIKIDDLLVGEQEAMHMASMIWGMLYKMKQPYLASFIARVEKDTSDMTMMSLPLFKMVAGFASILQEHTNKDERLLKALDEARAKSRMREMFGMREEPE
jgi:hypothetical protein